MERCSPKPIFLAIVMLGIMFCSGCAALFGPADGRAQALLLPADGGSARGMVTFVKRADGLQLSYNLHGLSPHSEYRFQIGAPDACNISTTERKNAAPQPDTLTLDDLQRLQDRTLVIRADEQGIATGFIVMPVIDDMRALIGRSLMVLRYTDTLIEPPATAAPTLGLQSACGVIRK